MGADKIKLIITCESAKEASKILQTPCECTSDVKRYKPLILITRFEELCMKDDENLSNFCSRLCDILMSHLLLVKGFQNPNLCEKLLVLFLTGFNQRL